MQQKWFESFELVDKEMDGTELRESMNVLQGVLRESFRPQEIIASRKFSLFLAEKLGGIKEYLIEGPGLKSVKQLV